MAHLAYKDFKERKGKLLIPIKKPMNIQLSREVKQINREINHRRIIEYINSKFFEFLMNMIEIEENVLA